MERTSTNPIIPLLYKYASEGWFLFPVGRDKKPLTEHGFKDSTQTQAGINELFLKRFPGSNPAGYFQGQLIVDIDPRHGGSLEALEAKYGKLPKTRTHKTGSGGLHLIFKQPKGYDIRNTVNMGGLPGIDRRGNGGYIVLPPSIHESGNRYEVIDDLPIAEAPLSLIQEGNHNNGHEKAESIPGDIPEGQRNATLASLAGSMRNRGLNHPVIEAALLEVNQKQCRPPLPESEVLAIAQSISRYEPGNGQKPKDDRQPFPYTDMGNAERLFVKYGDIFRWVTERQRFIIWKGHAWEYDTADHTEMLKLAKVTIRDIINEPDGSGEDGYEYKIKHALSSESGKRQREMIALVKSEGNITISVNDLDKDIYLFNCCNATIDLRTGQARAQNREDLITITAPVDYNPDAKCPKWISFLNLIQNNNQAMIIYLQKISGYCMTGNTKTDIIPFCHGIGGNGKSTYWGVIRDKIMGSYAYEVDPDVFLVNNQKFKDSGQREELANLFGKRLVTATEIQEGRQLTINLLKAISGGESIHGDRKYERGITFKPTFKVILSGNNEPIIKDNTNGAWRRLKKIPFTVTISNQIDGFEETFNDELSGILNWLIEGCMLWQKEGLQDPQEVIEATAEYRKDQDLIAQYLDDCCIRSSEAEITKKDFKTAYQKWCTESSNKLMGDKELKQRLHVFGIKDGFNSAKTARMWFGVRLKTLADTSDNSDSKNLKPSHEDENLQKSMEIPVRSCPPEANSGQDNDPVIENIDNSQEIPDCPRCGSWDWTYNPDGELVCSCGYQMEGSL